MNQLKLRHHFINGPFVELLSAPEPMLVQFISGKEIIHAGQIEAGQWIRANRRWFCDWTIRVSNQAGQVMYEHSLNLDDQNVRVYLDSKSLGDTLAWIPQVERFALRHSRARIYVSYHWPNLIDESAYSNLHFIAPEAELSPCYASYSIGYYFDDISNNHSFDPRRRSLQEVASDILGLPTAERLPKLLYGSLAEPKKQRRVTIATTSTAACKHWLHANGWQELVDHLNEHGYEVMVIQKEPTELLGVVDQTGSQPITERIKQIDSSDFFIGLASGLSWLAWALKKPVLMISGFSLPETEFSSNCERVINTEVCHGCWNDTQYEFARNDWNWCPRHKGTTRIHECSREISTAMVLNALTKLIENR